MRSRFVTSCVIFTTFAVAVTMLLTISTSKAETMEQALVSAYMTSPILAAEQASLRSSDESVAQAISNWRPTVEFTTDIGVERNTSSLRSGSNRTQTRKPRSYSLDVTQSLYRGGRTTAETSKAENNVMAKRANLKVKEQSILLSAAKAYLDVYRDEAVLNLNQNNEIVLRHQLEATRDRFQVGEITRTDVYQSEARLARSTADLIQGKATLAASIAAYKNITSRTPKGALTLPPMPYNLPQSKEEAIREAEINNPSILASLYNERAAIDGIDSIRGEFLPTLEVSASASRSFNSAGESTRIDSADAMVTLTIPLYQSGSVFSRLRQSKQNAAETRLILEGERRNIAEQTARTWDNLQAANARVASFQTQIQASEVAFEGVEREASVGARTVLDILDAEQELLDARVSLIGAQRDETIAIFELLSVIGRLTAHELQLPVDIYDPNVHYKKVRDMWMGSDTPHVIK